MSPLVNLTPPKPDGTGPEPDIGQARAVGPVDIEMVYGCGTVSGCQTRSMTNHNQPNDQKIHSSFPAGL